MVEAEWPSSKEMQRVNALPALCKQRCINVLGTGRLAFAETRLMPAANPVHKPRVKVENVPIPVWKSAARLNEFSARCAV